MADTFPRFNRLPYEIRNTIWTLAANARPNASGAHFFSVYKYDRSKHGDIVPEGESAVVVARDCIDKSNPHILAVPATISSTHRLEDDANRFNPSMYLLDGGLWTACKESRLVMENKYRSKHWAQVLDEHKRPVWASYRPTIENRDEMPATGYIIPGSRRAIRDVDGDSDHVMSGAGETEIHKPWFFTMFPSHDLFIFPISEFLNRNACSNWFSRADVLAPTTGGYQGFLNVAFDFDPAWDEQVAKWAAIKYSHDAVEPAILDLFYDFVVELDVDIWRRKFWFIDHRIKPTISTNQQLEACDGRDSGTFYATDRRYVVVKDPDDGYYHGDLWHDTFEYGSIWRGDEKVEVLGSCAGFVNHLEECIREKKESEQWNIPSSQRDSFNGPDFGVLACEYL